MGVAQRALSRRGFVPSVRKELVTANMSAIDRIADPSSVSRMTKQDKSARPHDDLSAIDSLIRLLAEIEVGRCLEEDNEQD